MEKARKYRIIGVVFVVIGFITIGFNLMNLSVRTDAIDKIVEGLSFAEIWEGTIEQSLRAESLGIYGMATLILTVPFIVVAIIFITLSEKLKRKPKI